MGSDHKTKLIAIVGPTASGKTALSLKLAKKFSGEIISADSRAIYRFMDIGTAKPTKDQNYESRIMNYGEERDYFSCGIRHHLVDVTAPDKTLTLAQYKELAITAINTIAQRGQLPFLVGGTALYIYTVIDNWVIPTVPPNKKLREKLEKQPVEKLYQQLLKKDPAAKDFVDSQNKRRIIRALEIMAGTNQPFSQQRQKGPPLFEVLILGVKRPMAAIKKSIAQRTEKMLKAGLINEVKKLLEKGYSPDSPALSGIHYKEIVAYLKKKLTLPETIALINKNDEQLVRRQMTWFKKDQRIKWVKTQLEAKRLVERFIQK